MEETFTQQQQAGEPSKLFQSSENTSSSSLIGSASPSLSHRLQSVSRKYQQSTLRKSRSNTSAGGATNDNDGSDTSIPYHTIIIDCAPITFVDSMGSRALYEVCDCMAAYVLDNVISYAIICHVVHVDSCCYT